MNVKIFEAFSSFLVDGWKIEHESKTSGTRGVEVVRRDIKSRDYIKNRSTEEVHDEGNYAVALGDREKSILDIRIVEAEGLKNKRLMVVGGGREGDGGELVEGNGRDGGRDRRYIRGGRVSTVGWRGIEDVDFE